MDTKYSSCLSMIICSIFEVEQYADRATHLVSITDPDLAYQLPVLGLPMDRRLYLKFHDVTARDLAGREVPLREHVERALEFSKDVGPKDELLIHCVAGVSRSTGMAFAVLCQERPDATEKANLAEVLRIRPQAFPNMRVVELADEILGRNGRMIEVVERFYRGMLFD